MLNRRTYTALWFISLPIVVLRLWWKGRRQPAYRTHLKERFGRYAFRLARPCLWIHAVSVGETRAAQPLIKALRARYPATDIVLTHMTPTGRATAGELYSATDAHIHSVYLPYDLPWLQRRFLAHFRPMVGLVMETEVWPNLVAQCKTQGCPLLLVNGRLSERSFERYRSIGTLARETFRNITLIAAQADADAERFRALGASEVHVTGNIKFDNHPEPALMARGEEFRALAGQRKIVLAASTREGEEADLLNAAAPLIADGTLLVIVPRHPQRFDEIARLVAALGYQLGRRSQSAGPEPADQVWLGDSMGEMTAYYTLADVVLMGGTWRPLGGQNFIECCAVGTPVLLGPSTFNFADAASRALEAGAVQRCADVASAIEAARNLLHDTEKLQRMGVAGRSFAQMHGGATERTLALITPHVRELD